MPTTYAALLRAVNVGGTGKLPMADLRALCAELGFTDPATYIQSGNVVFEAAGRKAEVRAALEAALTERLGKPAKVFLRTATQLEGLLRDAPYPGADPKRVLVYFLDRSPGARVLDGVAGPDGETAVGVGPHVFVHYPNGMGRSKLKLPFAAEGTGRNLNSVRKIAALAAER